MAVAESRVESGRAAAFLAGVRGLRPIEWLAIIALAAGLAMRFAARPGAPFWMDEAATGAIVTQPDLASFLREVRWDVEAPLYYVLLRPWAVVFGASNAALRAPSVIFS